MIIFKVLKNENALFKALTMGVGNAYAYDVSVDKKVVATLQPGEETIIELLPRTAQQHRNNATIQG